MRNSGRGFTLVECIVALALAGFAILVGAALLTSQARTAERVEVRQVLLRTAEGILESARAGALPLRSGPVWLELVPAPRFASDLRSSLEVQPTDADATVEADVVRLLFVLVTCIEYYLNREPPKGRVVLRPGGSSGEAIVKISAGSAAGHQSAEKPEGGGGPLPPELADLEPLLGPLGGRLAFAEKGGNAELHLILPSRRDESR